MSDKVCCEQLSRNALFLNIKVRLQELERINFCPYCSKPMPYYTKEKDEGIEI
jgi:hypothetical protein